MKNLILFAAFAAMSLSVFAAGLTPKILYSNSYYEDYIAYDKDGVRYNVVTEKLADDTFICTILNNDKQLNVLKTFRTKGWIDYFHSNCSDDSKLILTQHLFNDDDKWEYVLREHVDDYYHYYIYNEDGKNLGELTHDIRMVFVNGVAQFLVAVDKSNYTYYFLSYQSGGSSFTTEAVSDLNTTRVYPNPVREKEILTIELGESLPGIGSLKIVDASGRVVLTEKCLPDDTAIRIPSIGLKRGTYVYIIECEGQIVTSDILLVD